MPEVAKRASSAAIARSEPATSWHPAAVAMPCTRAITGCGISAMRRIKPTHFWNSCRCQAWSWLARISLRSCPAQKLAPLPARTTTRALLLSPTASSSATSASIIASESAFSCFGRFKVKLVTPSLSERSTRGPVSLFGRRSEVMLGSLSKTCSRHSQPASRECKAQSPWVYGTSLPQPLS